VVQNCLQFVRAVAVVQSNHSVQIKNKTAFFPSAH
jgi:hypothetical protein